MRHTAREHFLQAVLPAFRDFTSYYSTREIGLRRDTKNAAAAAGALRDLPEHVFDDLKQALEFETARSYRESFWPRCSEYRLVCNFADVWKHRNISRSDRVLSSIDDVVECNALIRYTDHEGIYYGSRKLLAARLSESRERDLGLCLSGSLIIWASELVQRGLLPRMPDIPQLPSYFQSRVEAANASPIRVICHVQEHMDLPQRCFIFDETAGVLRPVKPGELFDFQYRVVMEVQASPVSIQEKR